MSGSHPPYRVLQAPLDSGVAPVAMRLVPWMSDILQPVVGRLAFGSGSGTRFICISWFCCRLAPARSTLTIVSMVFGGVYRP